MVFPLDVNRRSAYLAIFFGVKGRLAMVPIPFIFFRFRLLGHSRRLDNRLGNLMLDVAFFFATFFFLSETTADVWRLEGTRRTLFSESELLSLSLSLSVSLLAGGIVFAAGFLDEELFLRFAGKAGFVVSLFRLGLMAAPFEVVVERIDFGRCLASGFLALAVEMPSHQDSSSSLSSSESSSASELEVVVERIDFGRGLALGFLSLAVERPSHQDSSSASSSSESSLVTDFASDANSSSPCSSSLLNSIAFSKVDMMRVVVRFYFGNVYRWVS